LQISNRSAETSLENHNRTKNELQKKMVEELKHQWKLLWHECFNDKVRAEDVSAKDYSALNVERGTVIYANRDFKALNFKEILEQNMIENPDRFVQPDSAEGGWHKFARTKSNHRLVCKIQYSFEPKTKNLAQQKKSGRGWLHTT
jgi:hypothetical protein